MTMTKFLTVARKAGVAFLGVVLTGLSVSEFPEPWDKVAWAVLAIFTYTGVYATKNKDESDISTGS
jgi:fructose-specific phosphotransferase system IIC component